MPISKFKTQPQLILNKSIFIPVSRFGSLIIIFVLKSIFEVVVVRFGAKKEIEHKTELVESLMIRC
jgi:hypothetical protein